MYHIAVLLDTSFIITCLGSFRILLVFLHLLSIFCYFKKFSKAVSANRSLFDLTGLKCSRVTQFFSTSVLLIHLLRNLLNSSDFCFQIKWPT